MLKFTWCFILTSLFTLIGKNGFSQSEMPNIIVILTDDMGYSDLGVYESPRIRTPHLDRLAEEGMRFTSFYAENFCSPSRAALLTGSYAYRVGVSTVFWPDSKTGLSSDEITIAEILKDKGYATGIIGKWHLGHEKPFLPTSQGFDYYFGIPFSNDMGLNVRAGKGPYKATPIMRNEEVIERGPDQALLTKRYTEEAVQFITENRDNPFFLYLPHSMPHAPIAASQQFRGKSDFGLYGDVIEELDWSTGQIMTTLEELGLKENTLVVFLSDNGPWLQKGAHGGLSIPFYEGKGTTWEGGHRVPAIFHWPAKIPGNTVNHELATIMDLFPTVAQIVGAPVPEDRVIDGKNILPLLEEQTVESPYDVYFYYRLKKLQGIRVGNWKLLLAGNRRDYNNVNYDYSKDNFNYHVVEALYDLSVSPNEQRNVVKDYPEVVKDLKQRIEEHKREMKQNSRPLGSVN